jgi:hypothetical protein
MEYKEIDRFITADDDGNEVTIICLQTIIESKPLDSNVSRIRGLKEYVTTSRLPVTSIDSETFKIVTTGQITRKSL